MGKKKIEAEYDMLKQGARKVKGEGKETTEKI